MSYLEDLYERHLAPTEFHSYKVGSWYIIVQKDYRAVFNDHEYNVIGPFATSEEAVANGKLQTSGTPYIFQIRDREPK